ncbi:hypothetical protein KBZ00_25880 [Streptomyces sp. RK31]|uniref:hypothetical protein n=1 Tax=Streptomyces sp. RK31 TaxID=2824892 RepID=UPI001B376C29|nr:hypothetical protein [Streptomyces sp. RK31]MBQ0974530.1 hypothetical protein [Streptomyces sp. RK31]
MTHQPEPATTLPATWPPAVRDAFWTAVNAPTYEESAAATLAFAQLLRAAVSAAVAPPTNRAALDAARATNQRLNREKQRLESELATYRAAVAQWEISEHSTYVPLRSLAAIAKAAGVDVPARWELHYERVERAEAELRRMADETATQTPQPSLRDQHRAAWHALTPDQQTARLAELDTNDEPAAEAQQDETATETPDVYLTTPCDACNHTLNWHSSGETGCTVPRCACARYYHAAGARQDGAES